MMKLVAFCMVFACSSLYCAGKYLDGRLAETKVLPLQVDCPSPYKYIYLGGITFNGTAVSDSLSSMAKDECDQQLEEQKNKGGSIVSCFLTFGKAFATQDTGMVRTVYKCTVSKQDNAPGGADWLKGSRRRSLEAKPNGQNQITFRCPGVNEIVELEKIFQEGEEMTAGFEKRKLYFQEECYKQAVSKMAKGEKGAVQCTIQLTAEEAFDTVMQYRCSEPPIAVQGSTTAI